MLALSVSAKDAPVGAAVGLAPGRPASFPTPRLRSEEHTSELQSQSNLVCRLLLEKKNAPGAPELRVVVIRQHLEVFYGIDAGRVLPAASHTDGCAIQQEPVLSFAHSVHDDLRIGI